MKRKQLWTIITFILILGISIAGSNLTEKRIAVETAAERIGTALDRPVVVIDAGHGGMDGGCVSIDLSLIHI